MSREIILLALGAPEYGQMAFHMAASIKYHSPIPIRLVTQSHTLKRLQPWQRSMFDYIEEIKPQDYLVDNVFSPGLAKLSIYNYIDAEETIYFDVDGVNIRNVEELFELCKGAEFKTQVVGYGKKGEEFGYGMWWAKWDKIWPKYKLSDDVVLPFINSSFYYIRKGEEAKELFKQARKNYLNPIPVSELNQAWGSAGQPDELYMNIALAQTGIDASLPVTPVYFRVAQNYGKADKLETLQANNWVIGIWGGRSWNHKSVLEYYDRYMQKVMRESFNLPLFWKHHQLMKRKFVNA